MTAVNLNDMSSLKGYHAHVYFDEGTKDIAWALREEIEARFPKIAMGRFHEKPVGPHPMWSYQVAFGKELFGEIIAWMNMNRQDLTIFVHALTGEDLPDHTDFAMWLGDSVELKLSALD